QAPLALAQCQELLGERDRALQSYQAALAARAGDVQVVRAVAGFQMRIGRHLDAEPLLRRIVDRQLAVADADVVWARRALAMVLVARGQFQQVKEALALVGLGLDAQGRVIEDRPLPSDDAVEEQRARARVLATQPGKLLRAKAIALLEDLNRNQLQT